MEQNFPQNAEDQQQVFTDIPLYREVPANVFENFNPVLSENVKLAADGDLVVDIPTYHKPGVVNHPSKVSSADLSVVISDYPSSGRSFSPISSELPTFDASDILPLEATHIRVVSGGGRAETSEAMVFSAIEAYLGKHRDVINVTVETEVPLGQLLPSPYGCWKCTSGKLESDFSFDNSYTSFCIQCYVDVADGNLIVEWQRRRGSVRTFTSLFEHFGAHMSGFMDRAAGAESSPLSVSPDTYSGHLSAALSTVDKLVVDPCAPLDTKAIPAMPKLIRNKEVSPTGPADLFDNLFCD